MAIMVKSQKASGKPVVEGVGATVKTVRNRKTGEVVTVKGVGALKGSKLKISEGISLTKPIAEQALFPPVDTRKAG